MFTGIIEELGKIQSISLSGKSGKLSVKAKKVLDDLKIGDSIAVNGVCLTAVYVSSDSFTADVMAETIRRSGFSKCAIGDSVNLERAMAATGRFGGHIVAGHIDGTGTVESLIREENAVWITIKTAPDILKYIINKGSVALDGVSLTVAYVDNSCFKVSVIPHTAEETTLLKKRRGDIVNLENDLVGKYVEKLLFFRQSKDDAPVLSGLTLEKLQEYGF